jgi:hypothetical protein
MLRAAWRNTAASRLRPPPQHLDRHDAVVAGRFIPIVLQHALRVVRQTGFLQPLLRKGLLFGRQRQALDLQAGPRRLLGKTAPTAADFEHLVAGLQCQPVENALVFCFLGCRQRQGGVAAEHCARIRHRSSARGGRTHCRGRNGRGYCGATRLACCD